MQTSPTIAIVGAGFGGLAAAMTLAARGVDVRIFEAMAGPGGKAFPMASGGHLLEAGPTVFTMKPVFTDLFARAGADFGRCVTTTPLACLARHFWPDGSQLDLHADRARTQDAIGAFAGPAAAEGFARFCIESRAIYETLDHPFMRRERPNPLQLAQGAGLAAMLRIRPFTRLWDALGPFFRDPRLRQLFARYATYCGSSPFLAPATLMLIAHAEMEGVWAIEGGLPALARAMALEIARLGGTLRYEARVSRITTRGGQVSGLVLASGERIEADAVIVNADTDALAGRLLGEDVARAVRPRDRAMRSLSAVTMSFAGTCSGPDLPMHSVFFSADYAAEFRALAAGRIPDDPTVYLCALDRREGPGAVPPSGERFLALINAPPRGDDPTFNAPEPDACQTMIQAVLARNGVRLQPGPHPPRMMTPRTFETAYPGSGGGLYGSATHGAMASFRRPGARTRIPGLYCVGGSVHPGAGVPMAATSGMIAAEALLTDRASTSRSRPAVTPGGISTPSATMARTP
jgi:1-hydroxycarotenoid 3,4-desaturase